MCGLVRVDAREALQPGSSEPKDIRAHWLVLQKLRLDHVMGRAEKPETSWK